LSDGDPDGFVDWAFSSASMVFENTALERRDYVERMVRGGFPEAVQRQLHRRASGTWLNDWFPASIGDSSCLALLR
jgi:predicted AAA+ superfamily ATPase